MTKKELKSYLRMNIELKRLEEKMAEMRNRLQNPKSPILSDIPKSGGRYKNFADNIDELIELQEFYDKRAKEIIAEQIHIEKVIALLSDPVERAIIGYKYIDGLKWEQICVKINYGWERTHYYHSRALQNIKTV